ncbi:hypothetical protein NAPIS_ORF00624 [Vairimorpha apis BRL 01]|uniref:Uncharacterized protein n=1 Tax=Vairimorpha apis BRL 01 TaxID=1037528 RepID=T0MFF0_9MICR|nr:hypothetical protein NAPIS_ORF00624 [Vairimorpha apis BRL 01]
MFLFINTVTLLNIYNLEVQTKNFTIIDCKTSSVFSYGFVRDFLPSEYKNKEKNLFKFENDDLSELFFYKIASDYLKLNENRIYMIESDKAITMCDFTISINENCKIIDINPKFSFGKVDDNYQKIEIKNIDNYSKFIWDYFLQNTINNNKTILIYNIKKY